jgi:hypothetical protein
MNIRKIAIRAGLVFIVLPIVLVLILLGFFYSVFYFPNWTSATTGTIISSGQKREYLLYVPKSYDRAKLAQDSPSQYVKPCDSCSISRHKGLSVLFMAAVFLVLLHCLY